MQQYPLNQPWQQPNTQYPPQQYYYPPQYQQYYQPPPPPPKKSQTWLWVLLAIAVVLCAMCGLLGSTTHTQNSTTSATMSDVQPTDTPVSTQGTWTVTHTYKGAGEKATATFETSGDWRFIWTAQASNESEAFFGVSVYGSDGSLVDSGADATIPAGKKVTDSTDEHTGAGSFYLKVYAGVPWTIQVQEVK